MVLRIKVTLRPRTGHRSPALASLPLRTRCAAGRLPADVVHLRFHQVYQLVSLTCLQDVALSKSAGG